MSLVLMGSTSGSVTLQEPAVAGSTVLSLPATTGTVGLTTSQIGMKNRIINGAMMIDQRNNGASVTNTAGVIYTVDRWAAQGIQASKFTAQQNAGSVTPPAGFINYLGATSSSAYSVLTGDTFLLYQHIEGLNVADLGWGTANAQTVTLSFWVRSSLTGTFGGALSNSAANRSYPFSYTISSANTWEQKSVTIAGDTTGTWLTTNGIGIRVRFGLGSGSTYSGTAGAWAASDIVQPTGTVSVVGTNGATFYITGVQLELGSAATTFDFRAYGTELALCQRYYWRANAEAFGLSVNSISATGRLTNPVPMRTAATISNATFTVNTGSAGTVQSVSQTIHSQTLYNSANNWSGSAIVSVTGDISAEL